MQKGKEWACKKISTWSIFWKIGSRDTEFSFCYLTLLFDFCCYFLFFPQRDRKVIIMFQESSKEEIHIQKSMKDNKNYCS